MNAMTARVLHFIRYGKSPEESQQEGDEGSGGHSLFGQVITSPFQGAHHLSDGFGHGHDSLFAAHPFFKDMPSGMPPKYSQLPTENPIAEVNAERDLRCQHLLTPGKRNQVSLRRG